VNVSIAFELVPPWLLEVSYLNPPLLRSQSCSRNARS
jgi:hypothetical protein